MQGYPSIRIRIVDDGANEVLQSVLNREVDFGITLLGADDPDVRFAPLVEEPFVLACRKDHELASRDTVRWTDLAGHRFITVGRSSGNRLIIDLGLGRAGIRPKWFYEVQHLSTSLGLVEAGLGIAALPRMSLPSEEHPTIAIIPLVDPVVTRTVGLVRRIGATLSPSAERFYTLMTERWQDR